MFTVFVLFQIQDICNVLSNKVHLYDIVLYYMYILVYTYIREYACDNNINPKCVRL